jgi:hypothetical protein
MSVFLAFYPLLRSLLVSRLVLVTENLAPPTTGGPPSFDEATSASSSGALLRERLVATVAGLALHPSHRQTRDCD